MPVPDYLKAKADARKKLAGENYLAAIIDHSRSRATVNVIGFGHLTFDPSVCTKTLADRMTAGMDHGLVGIVVEFDIVVSDTADVKVVNVRLHDRRPTVAPYKR